VRADETLDAEVAEALIDDLNTPRALARLHWLYGEIKGPAAGLRQIELKRGLKGAAQFLGLLQQDYRAWLKARVADLNERANVAQLVDARSAARAQKNWAESDRIRDELAAMGIVVKDNKDGTTTWEVAR
jgi:cysteinyl-tRNA synthetase